MPTPAEIIAARVNGTYEEHPVGASDTDSNSFDDDSTLVSSVPSISDESAFPTLGGGKKSSSSAASTVLWGPSMKAPASASSANGANGSNGSNGHGATGAKSSGPLLPPSVSASKSAAPKFKYSTIQEAFSLDVSDQLNVTKPELIKILTSIKSETKTSIECTTSQHIKKRTFLITGKVDDVKQAKRLVIAKLTKPLSITFNVPSKLRSKIIGPQGRTLKPIIQSNDVKIDIGNVEETYEDSDDLDEDDVFATYVQVTVTGYAEGTAQAEKDILAIVNEETKNLSSKVKLESTVKPFAQGALKSLVEKYEKLDISIPDYKSSSSNILIVGDRTLAIKAKNEIKEILANLESKIVVEEVPIPQLKHQFLPIDTILQEESVLIKLPTEGETTVKFIGEKKKISQAQAKAKQITSQYKVEVLDMSKAHKGNLKHVRAVASFLNQNGVFTEIAKTNDVIINIPDNKTLAKEQLSSIPIEIVSKGDVPENVKNSKKSIVSVVNKITPDQTLVIDDIDSFLISKVPSTIKDAAKESKVSFVILGNLITLFSQEETSDSAEDFDDAPEASDFSKVNEALNQLRELASNLQTVVLSIPSAEQAHISGPRGSTLKSILSNVEPNSVNVKLHSNGTSSSEDEVYLHGIKSEVASVKKEIEEVIADAKEYAEGYSTTVSVPSIALSRLIGKSGANLNSLRDEFGIKIDVADEEEKAAENSKADIVIAGSKRNVELAKARVQQLTKKWADETLLRIRIESQYHRRMIGPNRVYINRLQDKYNVKIRFPSIDFDTAAPSTFADAPKTKDEVTIKGPSKGVAKAEEELKELLQFEKENGFKETIKIPSKAIARVIGKAGETINDIADGTGVEYNFKRDGDSEEKLGYAEVELTGSKSALKEAIKKIQEIINEIENHASVTITVDPKYHRGLIGQGGSAMKEIISKAGGDDLPRNRYFRLLSIPNEGTGSDEVVSEGPKSIVDKVIAQIKEIVALKEASVTEEYDLPKEKHRFIVGPSGSIRQALQTEFEATIDIPRPNDDSTIIKLQGLPEKVEALKAKITELTKDDWNVSIDVPQELHALVSERGAVFNKLKRDFSVEVSHGNLTRQAAKLSSAAIPSPPETAQPEDNAKTKFTIVDKESATSEASVIIPWRLKGDEKNTTKAAKFIEERLEAASGAKHVGWFYAAEPSSFSKIIGPQGAKVNQIRKKSNTFITVPRAQDKHANFVYLVGSEENLKVASAEIQNLLK